MNDDLIFPYADNCQLPILGNSDQMIKHAPVVWKPPMAVLLTLFSIVMLDLGFIVFLFTGLSLGGLLSKVMLSA